MAEHRSRKVTHWKIFSRSTKRYWFEITAFVFVSAGIFLMVERIQIKNNIYEFLVLTVNTLVGTAKHAYRGISTLLSSVETSDLVGIVLVIIGILMIAHKVRERAIERHPEFDHSEGCPGCRGTVHRIGRGFGIRITEMILQIQIKCYECTKCSSHRSSWRSSFD